jgi:hypothetical protein
MTRQRSRRGRFIASVPTGAYGGDVIRRWVVMLLVLAGASLVPMAHATSVDPTWIGGLYDNDDGDDAVLAVQSFVGELAPRALALGEPAVVVLFATVPDRPPALVPAVSLPVQGRAPPAA